MKKTFVKIICIILSITCIFTCVGCDDSSEPPVVEKPQSAPALSLPETGYSLVEKGKSEYKILLPQNPDTVETTAKDELVTFFKEATGITLPVVYDSDDFTYTSTDKYISLGTTSITEDNGVTATFAELQENGFKIKTVDASICLIGYSSYGTLYAVYEFLSYEFNYDFYTEGCYDLDKISDDVKTRKYDIVDVPDINTMQSNYGYTINDQTTANRYRMMHRRDLFLYVNGTGTVHNSIHILNPKSGYYVDKNSEPYYHDADGNPLYYDADGNELPLDDTDKSPYYEENGTTYYFDADGNSYKIVNGNNVYVGKDGKDYQFDEGENPYSVDGEGKRYYIGQDGKTYYYDQNGGIYVVENGASVYPTAQEISEPDYFIRASKKIYEFFYFVNGQDNAGNFDLCFSAHGDAEKFDEMTDLFVEEITDEFKNGSAGTMLVIGQRDIGAVCTCDGCQAIYKEYGAYSAIGVKFCDAVLDKVYAWFETAEGAEYKREFYIMLLAYERFQAAPTTKNANGEYVANKNSSGVALDQDLNEHFGIYLAPVSFDYTLPKEENLDKYDIFYQWECMANVFALYSYDTNFQCFFVPFNTFESKTGIYQTARDVNCISLFDAGQGQDGADFLPSSWSMLKTYLESKLRWDTDADLNYYTKKFFKGVYKDAADTMYSVYQSFRAHWDFLEDQLASGEISGQINLLVGSIEYPDFWPYSLLKGWYDSMNKAFSEIEYLKTENPEVYQATYNAMAAERIGVGFLLSEMYSYKFSEKDLQEIRLTFKADAEITNIKFIGPTSRTIANLLASWGL